MRDPVLALSPGEFLFYWFVRAVIGVAAFLIPFVLVKEFASLFGATVAPVIIVIGSYVLLPALLSFLFHRSQQVPLIRGGYFCYAGFFAVFGALAIYGNLRNGSVTGMLGSAFVVLVGLAMLGFAVWSTRQQRAAAALAEVDAYQAAREDQIQMQAEAMLRAEQLRRERVS